MKKFFGTDGIRGKADQSPFDDQTLKRIGFALSNMNKIGKPVLIGRDTRQSSERICRSVALGLSVGRTETHDSGIIPTPSLSYTLAHGNNYSYGIMVSASHNPYFDNGIKILSGSGKKISDEEEKKIEDLIHIAGPILSTDTPLVLDKSNEIAENYIERITALFLPKIKTKLRKIVIDTANGATSDFAPKIIGNFAEETIVIYNKPDGTNINKDCGSTHLETIKEKVIETGAELGVAFDGDGDRALFVDNKGNIVDGDHILAFSAQYMQNNGELTEAGVVSTVMANYGLEEALAKLSINLHRTAVGDRYVWQQMIETGAQLGGEQSGHIIFHAYSSTGDGIITALKVIEIMAASGKTLQELAGVVKKYPQVLYNLPVTKKVPINELPHLQARLANIEREIAGNGRVVLRYSGTENCLRIMVEGKDKSAVQGYVQQLVHEAKREIDKEKINVS